MLGCTAALTMLSACNNSDKQKNTDTNTEHNMAAQSVYACPMHPEVTGSKGDECTKCGMDLQPVAKSNSATIVVRVISDPSNIIAGKPADISIAITENGKKVDLDVAHEMKMHLLIVDDKLTWFDHIHPEEQADGRYKVTETFPFGGKYLLYNDYKPSGAAGAVYKHELEVDGTPAVANSGFSTKLTSVVDGYTVKLLNGSALQSQRGQSLQFSIEKDGKKVQKADIQKYLGANAHIVMIGTADKEFLHIHPMTDKRFPIYAETQIKKPGTYRIWVQFQIDGKVRTADFTVDVTEGEKSADDHSHHNH